MNNIGLKHKKNFYNLNEQQLKAHSHVKNRTQEFWSNDPGKTPTSGENLREILYLSFKNTTVSKIFSHNLSQPDD